MASVKIPCIVLQDLFGGYRYGQSSPWQHEDSEAVRQQLKDQPDLSSHLKLERELAKLTQRCQMLEDGRIDTVKKMQVMYADSFCERTVGQLLEENSKRHKKIQARTNANDHPQCWWPSG